jgi:diguanylate cyclase (GGDEF)-like protein
MPAVDISTLKEEYKANVLVVDDDELTTEIICNALSEICQAHSASTGQEALAFCERVIPDLILLDINMPEMNGDALFATLSNDKLTSSIPVIFITSDTSLETENKCWEAGCRDFVTKPFSALTLKHRISSHIENKKMSDYLQEQASTDGLTGISNRRYFDKYLEKQCRLANRSHRPISLLMVDIDQFKSYNDTYGHQFGDDCLKRIAKLLSNSLTRPTDYVARYGGEEFAIVLPDTDKKGASIVSRKILEAVKQLKIAHASVERQIVTASIGAASLSETQISPTNLISKADENLYLAKASGRDTYVI